MNKLKQLAYVIFLSFNDFNTLGGTDVSNENVALFSLNNIALLFFYSNDFIVPNYVVELVWVGSKGGSRKVLYHEECGQFYSLESCRGVAKMSVCYINIYNARSLS